MRGRVWRSNVRKSFVGGGLLALAALASLAFLLFRPTSPEAALAAFAEAWERHDWAGLDRMTGAGGRLAATFDETHEVLGITETRVSPGNPVDGAASLRVRHTLGGIGTWSYETRATLRQNLFRSSVVWRRSLLHPALRPGVRLQRRVAWPDRAPILGRGDAPLTVEGAVVSVGLEPRRIKERDATLAALEEELGLDPADVARALNRPGVKPHWFVPLTDLREERYQEIRPELAPIPGVVFRRMAARVTPTQDFARQVIGRVGEITAERLDELGPPYRPGDVVGASGLELVFEQQLAGAPAVELVMVDSTGENVATLERFPAKNPRPVRTTIDLDVQTAAEDAMAEFERGALVAIDAGTGAIRAVVSRPVAEPFNRALAGRYPPGSTFKIVTSAALLADGLTPDTRVACPRVAVVGRPFRNSEGRALGEITFRTAFVESCNTAFVRLARRIGGEGLVRMADTFGFERNYDLPLAVAGGRFPTPRSETELAAAAIGQGRVLTSPLHMASVAAAIASGTWRPPSLLSDEMPAAARPLDVEIVSGLKEWMRAVVREGTGGAAGTPSQEVAGKTGTAEFGPGDPPAAHAWFVGFRGTLAFAVIVEGGGIGGEVAAPVVARFLRALR